MTWVCCMSRKIEVEHVKGCTRSFNPMRVFVETGPNSKGLFLTPKVLVKVPQLRKGSLMPMRAGVEKECLTAQRARKRDGRRETQTSAVPCMTSCSRLQTSPSRLRSTRVHGLQHAPPEPYRRTQRTPIHIACAVRTRRRDRGGGYVFRDRARKSVGKWTERTIVVYRSQERSDWRPTQSPTSRLHSREASFKCWEVNWGQDGMLSKDELQR